MSFDMTSFIGGSIGDAFQKIMSVFKVDPTVALQSRTDIEKIQLELQGKLVDQVTQQIAVNQAEAANRSVFVAGWRPAIGWICGLALFTDFIVGPIGTWIAALLKHPTPFPQLDLGSLLPLLLGMLGLGAMRTAEKINAAPGSGGLQ